MERIRKERSLRARENEIPVISFDYMGPKSKEDKSEKIKSLQILVEVDRTSKWVFAHMVPKKGLDAHAIKIVGREIRLAGYWRMAFKSDQEPYIYIGSLRGGQEGEA